MFRLPPHPPITTKIRSCEEHAQDLIVWASVGVVHDGLHVVSRKQTSEAVANAFKPAVVVLLDDVDNGSFHEAQFIFLILEVVVDGNHCRLTSWEISLIKQ